MRLVDVALRAAEAGAAVVRAAAGTAELRVEEKGRADYVTEVDVAAERAVVDAIRQDRPDDGVLCEEGTGAGEAPAGGPGALTWVIDPLDGTTNFIRGLPFYAVSVSVEEDGVPVAAAVVDVAHDLTYRAARGEGAWLGDRRLAVSPQADLGQGLVLTGIPFRELSVLPRFLEEMDRVARASAGIRRMGSAALDLCAIAAGRAEVFWEHGLGRWDVSAGALIVEEAGGRVSDLTGGPTHLDSGDILASNGSVHDAMLTVLATGPSAR